jgi:hypothetical protein
MRLTSGGSLMGARFAWAYSPKTSYPWGMAFKIWKPALRCDFCRSIRPVDALKAWIMQPVGPTTGRGDGGRTHYVCGPCRKIRNPKPS